MRAGLAIFIGVAVLAAAGMARAEPCTTGPSPNAQQLRFPSGNAPLDRQFAVLLAPAMTPPIADQAKGLAGCTRAEFDVGGVGYVLTGENTDALAREATRKDGTALPKFYLVTPPTTAPRPPSGDSPPYVLVQVDSPTVSSIRRIYVGVPPDEMLMRDIAGLTPGAPPIMALNNQTRQLMVYGIPAPGPAQGQAPRELNAPDGQVFVADAQGGVRHPASGFVCPPTVSGKRLVNMTIYDPADGGKDVHCRYGNNNETSWFTLFLVKAPPQVTAQQYFDQAVTAGRAQSPAASELAPPLAPGPAPLPALASFWTDRNGLGQGVWSGKVGDWQVQLRASFKPGTEVAEVARILYATAYSTIRPGSAVRADGIAETR